MLCIESLNELVVRRIRLPLSLSKMLYEIITQLDVRGIIAHRAETVYKLVELAFGAYWQALHVRLSLESCPRLSLLFTLVLDDHIVQNDEHFHYCL